MCRCCGSLPDRPICFPSAVPHPSCTCLPCLSLQPRLLCDGGDDRCTHLLLHTQQVAQLADSELHYVLDGAHTGASAAALAATLTAAFPGRPLAIVLAMAEDKQHACVASRCVASRCVASRCAVVRRVRQVILDAAPSDCCCCCCHLTDAAVRCVRHCRRLRRVSWCSPACSSPPAQPALHPLVRIWHACCCCCCCHHHSHHHEAHGCGDGGGQSRVVAPETLAAIARHTHTGSMVDLLAAVSPLAGTLAAHWQAAVMGGRRRGGSRCRELIQASLGTALQRAAMELQGLGAPGVVVVTGSLHAVAAAAKELGLAG